MSFFPIMYSTLGAYTILNSELLTRIIGITINTLTNSITLMASNTISNYNHKFKAYMEELELLDIEIKLKLVENWLRKINVNMIRAESNLDIIYRAISESCHNISWVIENINKKINAYNNMWFKSWRTIDLDMEINKLKCYNNILISRLNLLNIGLMWENIENCKIEEIEQEPVKKLEYNDIQDFYNPGEIKLI
jgi:hypothetical protein